MDKQDIQTQLAQVKASIANLEQMQGILSDDQLQASLSPLQQRKAELEAQLAHTSNQASVQGGGAVAQGDGATAVGEGGVHVGGNVDGSIYTGTTTIIYTTPAGGAGAPLPPEMVPLRQMLVQYFSLGEMQTLTFDLGISHDDLAGDTRSQFAESLITHCYRNNKLAKLLQLCRQQRSFVEWPQVSSE